MSGLTKIWKDREVNKQTEEAGECSRISNYNVWMCVMESEEERKDKKI